MATAVYAHSYVPEPARSNTASLSSTSGSSGQGQPLSLQQPDDQQPGMEEQYNTLFCRALYDYDAQDPSALSFRTDDIIEVLTQQPSGWWDGLLGEERGWFPSNYVTIISDEEAELAFSQAELSTVDGQNSVIHPTSTDMVMTPEVQSENEEWLNNEVPHRNGHIGSNGATSLNGNQPSDFWIPEVTPDGQIYYVNTQTGQRSRDLPQEAEDEISDSELAGLASQPSSRSGTSAGLAFGPSNTADVSSSADEGPTLNGSSESWVKKLADDGVSHYYVNKHDGRIEWTSPDGMGVAAIRTTTSFPSATSRQPDISRLSVYSDDSDIQPYDQVSSARPRKQNGTAHNGVSSPAWLEPNQVAVMELTSAERIARSLQQALEPPPPAIITDLSAVAKKSIQAVIANVQAGGVFRQPEDDQKMDQLIYSSVLAVRNLLYVASSPIQPTSSNLPGGMRESKSTSSQAPLKPAQRKVTATLSRLVLSARAMQYDSGSHVADTLNRIESDSEELERAISSFLLEVQRNERNQPSPYSPKRLHGVFSTANIGLGLVGGGMAGSWKGFGYVSTEDEARTPHKVLDQEVVSEISISTDKLKERLSALNQALRLQASDSGETILLVDFHRYFAHPEIEVEQIRLRVQELVTSVSAFLALMADVHVARHVDIDGIRQSGDSATNDQYSQSVEKARQLVRTLEAVTQSIYDDSSALLLTTQSLHDPSQGPVFPTGEEEEKYDLLDHLSSSLSGNIVQLQKLFEELLSVGHEQAEVAQGDYADSIEWRMSRIRMSVINDDFGANLSDPYKLSSPYETENEDVVDFGDAVGRTFRKPAQQPAANSSYDLYGTFGDEMSRDIEPSVDETLVAGSTTDLVDDVNADEDERPAAKAPARPAGDKLAKILGKEYADKVAADLQPWYLRSNYSPSDIIIEVDGSVRGGTVPALVERLTAHEHLDTSFIKAFLMTFKSFTTLDELFDLLVARFRIQPPENLTPAELEEWGKLKQHVIQVRVMNTLKAMVVEEGVLEKEDMHILERMKEFISTEDVSKFAAAKHLMIQIDRVQNQGGEAKTLVSTTVGVPPPPILPKSGKKLKLLDIDPLELARQLTLIESELYQKIKPMECLQRSREQKSDSADNITTVIQTSNRIADWVAHLILSKEDSRRRAAVVKHLIAVADRCRTLNNFSTMIAITSGLNTPPIRRLKRTWEQVSQRFMAQFGACEMTIDSNKNFTKYRSLMASVTPPCVPFIGVFLSTLQFIQDGNNDNLPGGLVNFRKRQKASEVINDIKRWQALPFNFTPLPNVQAFIKESLDQFSDTRASSDHFWHLSLEREPREREDEKMARLLQESGFL
ncbi:hypothetical protein D9613_005997 [Agrocybe pediades]|uniref:Ras GEF n=1 Tax=Agrocybe pediades TaxID=84607 RepID=A0A8H4VPF1_9AGAR|nr:hypothetical protein D9613_005997 [Agrocybe pediades]